MSVPHNNDSFEDDYADDDFHEFSNDLDGHDDADHVTGPAPLSKAVKEVYATGEEGTGEAVELSVDPDTGVLNLGDPISISPTASSDGNLYGTEKRDEQVFSFQGEVLMDEEERKRQAIYKRSHAHNSHTSQQLQDKIHDHNAYAGGGEEDRDMSSMRHSLEHSYSNDKFDSPSPILQKRRDQSFYSSHNQSQNQTQQANHSNNKYTGDAETKSSNTSMNSPIQYRNQTHSHSHSKQLRKTDRNERVDKEKQRDGNHMDSDRDLLPPDLLELLGDLGGGAHSPLSHHSVGGQEDNDGSYDDDESLYSRESNPVHKGMKRQKKSQLRANKRHHDSGSSSQNGVVAYGYKNIRKELDIALKRLAIVEKEKTVLSQNNDSNYLSKEVDKLRSTLTQREATIKALAADKKGLESMMRNQAKKLQEMSYEAEHIREFGNNSSLSNQKQFEVMMERIKRLNEHVKEYRDKGRDKDGILKKQKKTIERLKSHLLKVLKEQKEAQEMDNDGNEYEGNNEGSSMGQVPSIVQDSVFSQNAPSLEGASLVGAGSMTGRSIDGPPIPGMPGNSEIDGGGSIGGGGSVESTSIETGLRRALLQLQKSMSIQKASHLREVTGLSNELKTATNAVYRLEAELDEREKHSRTQVMMVARLRKTCEELEAGNNRLIVASDLYSRAVAVNGSGGNGKREGGNEDGEGEEVGEIQNSRPPPVSTTDGGGNVLNTLEYSIRSGPQRPQQGPQGSKRPVQRKYQKESR